MYKVYPILLLFKMQNFNRVVFQDEQEEANQVEPSEYNKAVLKSMAKNSPLTLGMVVIVSVMFIICVLDDFVNGNKNMLPNISGITLKKYGANYYNSMVGNEH